jgi:hypothetical protein
MRVLVFGSAFLSGFVVMVLEMLGGRIIAPWFGGDIYVWGSIITVFMLALSLGYLIGGRWSLHNANLWRYGSLFLGAGLAILPVVFIAQPIMGAIFDRLDDARYGSLLASMALFLLPSIVMGMVSPYSVRLLTQSRESSGASAGVLYFVSTLGSALGTLATSFYLVAWLEVNQILFAAVGIFCLNGLVLMAAHKLLPRVS